MPIVDMFPSQGKTNIEINPVISVTFDTDLELNSVNNNTVYLYETDTAKIVDCVVAYNNKEITIKLYGPLKKYTQYSIMFIEKGIYQLNPHIPVFNSSFISSFTTSDKINYNNDYVVTQEPPNQGEPNTPQIDFKLEDSNPKNLSIRNDLKEITLTFNKPVVSYETIEITANDVAYYFCEEESNIDNYDIVIEENIIRIKPKADFRNKFRYSTDYLVNISNIVNTEGKILENVVLDFTTKLSPLYISVRQVRNAFGDLLNKTTDEQIELLIYEASIFAYQYSNKSFPLYQPPQIVREFVFCYVKQLIFDRLYAMTSNTTSDNTIIKRKTLADFTIEYGTDQGKFLDDLLKRINDCVNKLGRKLGIEMYALVSGGIQATVKSWNDPRKPIYPNRYYSWNRLGFGGRNSFIKDPINYRIARVKIEKSEVTFLRPFGYKL